MNNTEHTEDLLFEVQSVKSGLIDFAFRIADRSFETRFSEVYEPIISLRHWLEAISIGVHQCSFCFDTEGEEIRFSFEYQLQGSGDFVVSERYDPNEVFLAGRVQPKQFVSSLYRGFLADWEARPEYKSEWEPTTALDCFREAALLHSDDPVGELLELERDQILEQFDKAFPIEVDSVFGELPGDYQPWWVIPEDFDTWTRQDREMTLESHLQTSVSGLQGTQIGELKSELIDRFIVN